MKKDFEKKWLKGFVLYDAQEEYVCFAPTMDLLGDVICGMMAEEFLEQFDRGYGYLADKLVRNAGWVLKEVYLCQDPSELVKAEIAAEEL